MRMMNAKKWKHCFELGQKVPEGGPAEKKSINLSPSLTHFLSYGGLLAGFGNFTGTNVVSAVMLAVWAPPRVNWNLLKVYENIGMTQSIIRLQKMGNSKRNRLEFTKHILVFHLK